MGFVVFMIVVLSIGFVFYPWATAAVLGASLTIIILTNCSINRSDKKIVSAEVVNRTRVTREECEPSGFSIGSRGGHRVYWRFRQVFSHIQVELDVVYENGKHRRLTLTEGDGRYKRIMAICEKRKEIPAESMPVVEEMPEPSANKVDFIDIKTNQLVAGVYVIGRIIPAGNYDFRWVWGSGEFEKYPDSKCEYDSDTCVTASVGNEYDYQQRVLVNVVCKPGEYLCIRGNVILEIRKSKPVVLDL